MRAGRLDRRITFQSLTDTQDALGGLTESWANLSTTPTAWAEVRPLRGREFFSAQQINAEVDTVFIIRHRTDITTKMRILYDGDYYNIHSIAEIGRRDGLEIRARSINGQD